MSDPRNNYNLTTKKKKYRRKKKNPNLVSTNQIRPPFIPNSSPAATLEGLKTIANLIQLHQQLTQKRAIQEPQPLMSGPRFSNSRFNPRFSSPGLNYPSGSMFTQNKEAEVCKQEDPEAGIKNEGTGQSSKVTEPNANKNQNANALSTVIKKETVVTQRPVSKNVIMKQNNKGNKANLQFDDFEIYDSPSFINFDETSEVVELNDDDLFAKKNINNDKKNTLNIKKEFNFQKKIQQQFAKKMEIKNQEHSATAPIKNEEKSKKINEELHEAISSDIRTVVQDNIKINIKIQQNITPKHCMDEGYQENKNIYNPSSSNTPSSNFKLIESNENVNRRQVYSPTDMYDETQHNEVSEQREGSESPDALEPGQKRVSAFQRLGPLKQTKKPKLTINLSLNKDQDVREVLDVTKLDIPVHERDYIINSTNEIVLRYLPQWPFKRSVPVKKCVTARNSKTVMMLEKEQMEKIYDEDDLFIMIVIRDYPPSWTKEDVLDLVLDNLSRKSFIPCFIEHTTKRCKLLVVRSCGSLLALHSLLFAIRYKDVQLSLTICQTTLTVAQLNFVPRLVLRRLLSLKYDDDSGKLDLKAFTLDKDVSHFIYYPLNRPFNQEELLKIQSDVQWMLLAELDLSNNNIDSIESFHLETSTPNLKVLNLSNNRLNKAMLLLPCRYIPLQKLYLEGNPLCLDYICTGHYVKVFKTMFSTLRELDGVPITPKGELPKFKKYYNIEEAHSTVSKFLDVFFPLLECDAEDRNVINLYQKDAIMTITYWNKLRYEANKNIRNLLIKSQCILEGDMDQVEGSSNIEKLIKKWPNIQHDPSTFTVDVMYRDEYSTIIKITGILKIIANSLAEEEPVLAFSRNIHLRTKNGYHYKIYNEMLYWDEPTMEYSNAAFRNVMIPKKELSLKFETTPDEECKKRLVSAFMTITELNEVSSERCLDSKGWHFQHALEYFMKLLKLDDLNSLMV